MHVFTNRINKFFGIKIILAMFNLIALDANCQIFGHFAGFDRVDAGFFKLFGEVD